MTISTGLVVPGSESPVGVGGNGAVRCTLRTGGQIESVILKRQPLPQVLAADEAIDNRDRNLQNVLWNGTSELWIDHENALGNGARLKDTNKLCEMAVALGRDGDMSRAAIAAWMVLDRAEPEAARDLLAVHADTSAQASFVAQRLSGLGQRILSRFPAPNDLLSGA
ncbi:MAG: hypothetical protein RJA63_4104 [Pseudomonadota bacterium]